MISDLFTVTVLIGILSSGIRLATPYLYAAIGETFGQRSGVLNLGVEGQMLLGAFAAFYVALTTGSLWLGVLAAVIKILGEEGFRVLGAHEILQAALGPKGVLSRAEPDAQAMADIDRGVAVARALGVADVGQGCVVQLGLVLAVEAVEGTDAMLARCAPLARAGPGGVLVKVLKPGQDRRADLPTIGPDTIRNAAAAGLRGVAFEAGATILVERETTIAAADAAGLFLLGLDPETIQRGS